jgi:hypothetical protein
VGAGCIFEKKFQKNILIFYTMDKNIILVKLTIVSFFAGIGNYIQNLPD